MYFTGFNRDLQTCQGSRDIVWEVNMANVEVAYPVSINMYVPAYGYCF